MKRNGLFVPLLAMRGPVSGLLDLVGGLSFLIGVLALTLALLFGGGWLTVTGLASLGLWYAAFWLRYKYDVMVLRRTPEEHSLHLF
jgi:hypothetical protein